MHIFLEEAVENIQRGSSISFPFFGDWSINPPASFTLFGKEIYMYGVVIALGFILGILFCSKKSSRFGIKEDDFYDLMLFLIPLCIIGARLYFVAFEWDYFKAHPSEIIAMWNGGMAIFGGIIFGFITIVCVSKHKKIPALAFVDLIVFGLLIGQIIGRWGNFFNREAFGSQTDFFLKMGLTNEQGKTYYVHPTFLYEGIWNLICLVYLSIRLKKGKREYDGQFTLIYFFWYGLGRSCIEGLRVDSLYIGNTNLRVTQFVALTVCFVSMILLIINLFREHSADKMYVNHDKQAPSAEKLTREEAIAYIEDFTWSTSRLGLERTAELLEKLGNPQKKLKFVHVTGSNGKGSTCAFVESVLRKEGYKTGMYISPYIQDFCERIQLCGNNIPGEALADITSRVKVIADAMEDHPSQFELVTAIGMVYFAENDCDIVVLEVGMGGALDSTNVIDAPEVAVLTNVGLEHTEYLGDTISAIAATKCGIIKKGCCAVCYDSTPEAVSEFKKACEEQEVPFVVTDFSTLEPISVNLTGQRFKYRDNEYSIELLGAHQLKNAATAIDVIETLRFRGWHISDESLSEGLKCTSWPARLEILRSKPLFVLDGGHNPQCAQALAESLKDILIDEKAVFLSGVLADKDYAQMIDLICPFASEFICVTPESHRALSAEALAEFIKEKGFKTTACSSIQEGVATAMEAAGEDGTVIAFGSLYMSGEIRTAVLGEDKTIDS